MSCGSVKRLCVLADQIAPAIVEEARERGADVLFLVPLCQILRLWMTEVGLATDVAL